MTIASSTDSFQAHHLDFLVRIAAFCHVDHVVLVLAIFSPVPEPVSDPSEPFYEPNAMLFLISAIALAGFKPFGHVLEQFRMV